MVVFFGPSGGALTWEQPVKEKKTNPKKKTNNRMVMVKSYF